MDKPMNGPLESFPENLNKEIEKLEDFDFDKFGIAKQKLKPKFWRL